MNRNLQAAMDRVFKRANRVFEAADKVFEEADKQFKPDPARPHPTYAKTSDYVAARESIARAQVAHMLKHGYRAKRLLHTGTLVEASFEYDHALRPAGVLGNSGPKYIIGQGASKYAAIEEAHVHFVREIGPWDAPVLKD